ncbi:MAG: hypothetical protein Q8P48_11240, partial [Deltaproteobacteria bacterium]|nr:hypothetical protein [Deltaproteobacteria bacterium]
MDETTLDILEFPAVLHELASFTMTAPGRARALALRPLPDRAAIDGAFAEFLEMSGIIKAEGTLPLGGVSELAPLFKKAEPAGAYLLPEDLMLVKGNLYAAKGLKAFINTSFSRVYPRTSVMLEGLSSQKELLSSLERVLDEKGEIKDDASAELLRIRKGIRSSRERARSILEGLTSDKKTREEFLQEDFITIRDDRYVLCIKSGMQTAFNGVIHGRSGSGSAYFIEPMQLVELNNKVAVLRKEEKAEEIEILKGATSEVLGRKDALASDLGIFGALDSMQARALFAHETGSVAPVVRKGGRVRLRDARHPILILKERKGGQKVAP